MCNSCADRTTSHFRGTSNWTHVRGCTDTNGSRTKYACDGRDGAWPIGHGSRRRKHPGRHRQDNLGQQYPALEPQSSYTMAEVCTDV